jgi:hypothetical protein
LEVMGNIPGIGCSDDPEGGVIELGGSVLVGSSVAVVEGVFGTPHTCDFLVLTCLSVGSHMGFAPGVVSDPDGTRWKT